MNYLVNHNTSESTAIIASSPKEAIDLVKKGQGTPAGFNETYNANIRPETPQPTTARTVTPSNG